MYTQTVVADRPATPVPSNKRSREDSQIWKTLGELDNRAVTLLKMCDELTRAFQPVVLGADGPKQDGSPPNGSGMRANASELTHVLQGLDERLQEVQDSLNFLLSNCEL